MSEARELTDSEVDVLLERFDRTDPQLQRRIVARLVADRARLADLGRELLAALNEATEAKGPS